MRILAHIHTFNDRGVLDCAIKAVLGQTRPLDGILLVDNGSTDGTLERIFPSDIAIVRHTENRGTSGSVLTGFRYALEHGYDWIWILDADSVPREDALAKLVEVLTRLPADERSRVGVLSSCMADGLPTGPADYFVLTPKGPRPPRVDPDHAYVECDCTIWSGTLYNLEAVRRVGLPRVGPAGVWDDLSLDMGDIEFSYRLRKHGYRLLVDPSSLISHPMGMPREVEILGRARRTGNHSPFRRYLFFRNLTYFWLYVYSDRQLVFVTAYIANHALKTIAKLLLLEDQRTAKIGAILRGIWDGITKQIHRRY